MSQAQGQRRRRNRQQVRKRIAAALAALGTVVGFLVAATSLFDWFEGKLDNPEPRPPAEIDARVSSVALSNMREPYEDYLESSGQSAAGLSAPERKEQGLVFLARVRLKGSEGSRYALRLALFNAKTGEQLPDPIYSQIVADFKTAARNHARSWPIWFPYPLHRGTYFSRATLLDAKRQPVDEEDSKSFRVTRIPALPN